MTKGKTLGVPLVELDLDKTETFAPAPQGIDRVLLMTGYTVDLLRQAKCSSMSRRKRGAVCRPSRGRGSDDATVAHWVWHQLVERYIEWRGFSFTHLRPEQFMLNLLGYSGKPTVINGIIEQSFGNARLSWVDCEDVAAVAVSLKEAEAHHGQTYQMEYASAIRSDQRARCSRIPSSRDSFLRVVVNLRIEG